MFLGKTYQEFSPALTNDAIVVVRGRVSVRDDGVNLHAVSHVHSGYRPEPRLGTARHLRSGAAGDHRQWSPR